GRGGVACLARQRHDGGAARMMRRATPLLLSAPALLLFCGIVLAPICMTVALSFQIWSLYRGIEPIFTLKNWLEIFGDDYFYEIFLRTFRIGALVTVIAAVFGAPEAYIINRMRNPWKGLFLLIVLGPLLISVVARTLGWALLFGGETGLINKSMLQLGLISTAIPFMFTETGTVIALSHVLMPFMVLSVWAVLQRLDPQVENAALSLGASPVRVLWRVVLPQVLPGALSVALIAF